MYLLLNGIICGSDLRRLLMLQIYEVSLADCFFFSAVNELEDSVDARLTLSSILLEEGKDDEAVFVLSPPKASGINHILSILLIGWL